MDETFQGRTRITNPFYAAVLSLLLSLLLAACGGGGVGATDSNSAAVAAGQATPNSATLSWDPPAATANLAGYRIYIGTAPGTYQQPLGQGFSVGNVTTYTLMGLSAGTRYYFSVTAIDTSGNESTYSNEAYKDIP